MDFDIFQKLLNGTHVDFDGAYGAQCADLIMYWNRLLGNQNPFTGNAIDFFNQTFDGFYTAVPNIPEGVPQKGDIVCFNQNMGGGFGHVVISNGIGDTNTFQAFSQNDPTGSGCVINTYDYANVIGWLHPNKLPENPLQQELDQARSDRDTNWNIANQIADAIPSPLDPNDKAVSAQTAVAAIDALKNAHLEETSAVPPETPEQASARYPTMKKLYDEVVAILNVKI